MKIKDRKLKIWHILLLISPIYIFPLVIIFDKEDVIFNAWIIIFSLWLIVLFFLKQKTVPLQKNESLSQQSDRMLKHFFTTTPIKRQLLLFGAGFLGLFVFIVMFFGAVYYSGSDLERDKECKDLAYKTAITSTGKIEKEVYTKELNACLDKYEDQTFTQYTKEWLIQMYDAFVENQSIKIRDIL